MGEMMGMPSQTREEVRKAEVEMRRRREGKSREQKRTVSSETG